MKINKNIWMIVLGVIVFFIVALIFVNNGPFVKAEKVEFSLIDSFGREVTSQDYEGVPIFLEFGACW